MILIKFVTMTLSTTESLYKKKYTLHSPHTIPIFPYISNIFKSYNCPFLKRRTVSLQFIHHIKLWLVNHLFIKQEVHIKKGTNTDTTHLLSTSLISGRNCSLSKDTLLESISSCELYEIYSSKRRLQNKATQTWELLFIEYLLRSRCFRNILSVRPLQDRN